MQHRNAFVRAITSMALAGVSSACMIAEPGEPSRDAMSSSPRVAAQAMPSNAASHGVRIVVDVPGDSADGRCQTDGTCTGACNLRAALSAAEAHEQATVVLLVNPQVELGPFVLAAHPAGVRSLTITADARRSILGSERGRLLVVGEGVSVTLEHLDIAHFVDSEGGAVLNEGELTLRHVTFADNTARCSGVGVLTAFATCGGGAIANHGTLTIAADTRFERNSVLSEATTASYTTATAQGGAIYSTGAVEVRAPVLFRDNGAIAMAQSGIHEGRPGGALADAAGGAVYNAGVLRFTSDVPASCAFVANAAGATARSVSGYPETTTISGGAVRSPGALSLPSSTCSFHHNQPLTGTDVDDSPLREGPASPAQVSPS